jgi:acetyl-CoA C-acetyltransferase
MESMSNVPHYLPGMRMGSRLGHAEVVDGLIKDGLWDPHNDAHMGNCAELCAEHYQISRQEMDDHAVEAFQRAQAAAPFMQAELVPVQLPPSKQSPQGSLLDFDESLSKINESKLRGLKPFFKQDGGSVTAGNSSPITDGGCALVLVSAAKAAELGCPVLAVVRGYGDANQDPEWFTTAPAAAVPKALKRAGLQQQDIDYWEINQAFSVVDLVNQKLLGLQPDRVNVHGGAVALGHPLGASGAIIITRLISVLRAAGGRRGLAAICNGGGGASAIVIELVNSATAQL